MRRIAIASDRLARAEGLAGLLDAAHDGFEQLLWCLRAHEDPRDGRFAAFLLSATRAANGRDTLLFAPSIPSRSSYPATDPGEQHPGGDTRAAARTLAGFAELLAGRLGDAAEAAGEGRDRAACLDAARYAREVAALLTGGGP